MAITVGLKFSRPLLDATRLACLPPKESCFCSVKTFSHRSKCLCKPQCQALPDLRSGPAESLQVYNI